VRTRVVPSVSHGTSDVLLQASSAVVVNSSSDKGRHLLVSQLGLTSSFTFLDTVVYETIYFLCLQMLKMLYSYNYRFY